MAGSCWCRRCRRRSIAFWNVLLVMTKPSTAAGEGGWRCRPPCRWRPIVKPLTSGDVAVEPTRPASPAGAAALFVRNGLGPVDWAVPLAKPGRSRAG